MKIHFVFLTFLLLTALGQSQTFQKTFGGTGADYGTDVIQTADKGYALMGVLNHSVYLVKTDSLGNKQWSKTFGTYTPSNGEFRAFSQTADSGIVFGGRIDHSGSYYAFTVKTDAAGNIVWSKMHSGMGVITSIKATNDGGYIAAGNQYFSNKATVAKFSSAGNMVWSRVLPIQSFEMDVIQLAADSGFITCYHNASGPILISRWTQNGSLVWNETASNLSISPGANMGRLHENGNMVQVAINTSNSSGLLSIKKDGTSAKMIGVLCQFLNCRLSDAFPAANKGSLLVAQYNVGQAGYGTRNIILSSVDSLGTINWSKQVGGANEETSASVKQTLGKGIVIAGSTKSFSSGFEDIYLVKTDSTGQSGCNTSPLTYSTTVLTITLTSGPGPIDSIANNITSTQPITALIPADSSYDACGCVAPIASFTPDINGSGSMKDNSTWATKWYWTCTCMPGVVDSTVISKSYGGGSFPNGTYTVCLKVKNSCGVDSLCKAFTYGNVPVGIEETAESLTANYYPNPVHDKLVISREGTTTTTEMNLRIYNALGVLVYSDKMEGVSKEISVEHLEPGLYVIQFAVGTKMVSRKLVKD